MQPNKPLESLSSPSNQEPKVAKYSTRHCIDDVAKDVRLDLGLSVDILDMTMVVAVTSDLEVTGLNVAGDTVETRLNLASLPGRKTRVENVVHLFKGLALSFWGSQEHVDEGNGVECSEDHVHLPVDGPQKRGNGKSQNAVPAPIGGGSERHGLRANLGGEDLQR